MSDSPTTMPESAYQVSVGVWLGDTGGVWLEDTGGVMPIPYTFEQIEDALDAGDPPASLRWLLNLGTPFFYREDEEDLLLVFNHLEASYSEEGWTIEVSNSDPSLGFEPAQELPYYALSPGLAVCCTYQIGKEFPDGFAPAWNLPYQIDPQRNQLFVLNFSPINKPETQAKIEAGWYWADPLPYSFSQDGAMIVSPLNVHQGYGWERAMSIGEFYEYKFQSQWNDDYDDD